jgi:hypothetical protein
MLFSIIQPNLVLEFSQLFLMSSRRAEKERKFKTIQGLETDRKSASTPRMETSMADNGVIGNLCNINFTHSRVGS